MTNYRGRPRRSHPRTRERTSRGRMNGSACDNFIQDSLALGSAREGGRGEPQPLPQQFRRKLRSRHPARGQRHAAPWRGAAPRTGIPRRRRRRRQRPVQLASPSMSTRGGRRRKAANSGPLKEGYERTRCGVRPHSDCCERTDRQTDRQGVAGTPREREQRETDAVGTPCPSVCPSVKREVGRRETARHHEEELSPERPRLQRLRG